VAKLVVAENSTCSCGAAGFSLHAKALGRFYCHCLICQALYKAPFADVTVFWAGSEYLRSQDRVEFKRYRLPPALQRGTCRSCGSPVLGYLRLAPFVRLLFVPTSNLKPGGGIPESFAHIFYHRRVQEATDSLPKVSGYWHSQLAVTKHIISGAVRG
jgi:hypothetical protein